MRLPVSARLLSLVLFLLAAASAARAEDALLGEWRVIELDGAPVVPGSTITLNFGADGRLSGKASCNRYGAGYRAEGRMLAFSKAFATQMACPPPLMRQERRFFDLLQAKVAWAVDKDRLTLQVSDRVRLSAVRD